MAITLTRNLKLKLSSTFDELSKYNLNKIDTLASLYQVNTNEEAVVRSKTDIRITPQSQDIGGTGVGGTVYMGSDDQPLSSLVIRADSIDIGTAPLNLGDQAVGGTKSLLLKYDSALNGPVDTVANRTLSIDLDGADRSLVIGSNLTLSGLALSLTTPVVTSWTLPATPAAAGQVLSNDGSDVLSWANPATSSTSAVDWLPADGITKNITHAFGTTSVNVSVQDADNNFATIEVDSITRPSSSSIQLTSSHAPTGPLGWKVILS